MTPSLQNIQRHIAQTVCDLPEFKDVPVLTRQPDDWKNPPIKSIQPPHGLSMYVLPPSPYFIPGIMMFGFFDCQYLVQIELEATPPRLPLFVINPIHCSLNRREIKIDGLSAYLESGRSSPYHVVNDPSYYERLHGPFRPNSIRPDHFIVKLQFYLSELLPPTP